MTVNAFAGRPAGTELQWPGRCRVSYRYVSYFNENLYLQYLYLQRLF